MRYIISDIHGDFKNFQKMLKKIRFSKEDQMYILGDIFDKGTENLKIYEFVRNMSNICLIKGNHEFLCERYLNGTISALVWDSCAGINTRREVDALTKEEKKELYKFLNNLPIYKQIQVGENEYFLTHSGYNAEVCIKNEDGLVDIEASVKEAAEQNLERYLFSDDIHCIPASVKFDKKIIVGHYPTIFLEDCRKATIFYGEKYIDVDTGNERRERGGRLSCLRMEDRKEFYV